MPRALWNGVVLADSDQCEVLDGNQYFNRPGPRLAESLEILAEILDSDRNV